MKILVRQKLALWHQGFADSEADRDLRDLDAVNQIQDDSFVAIINIG